MAPCDAQALIAKLTRERDEAREALRLVVPLLGMSDIGLNSRQQAVVDAALSQPQGEQKQARGKRCTCDTSNGGSIPCYVEGGGKLGDLWYCAKARQESGNG